jgi:hypothetical protein
MRALIDHQRTYSVSYSAFQIQRVIMSGVTAASKRDLFFRCFGTPNQGICIYACSTLEQASAAIADYDAFVGDTPLQTAFGVTARKEGLTPGVGGLSIVLDDFTGNPPVITALILMITNVSLQTPWDAVWAYTAAPQLMVAKELSYILGLRSGAGQILEAFTGSLTERTPEEGENQQSGNDIIVSVGDVADIERVTDIRYALSFPWKVTLTHSTESNRQDAYDALVLACGSVASLLGDECFTLNMVCIAGYTNKITRITKPSLLPDEATVMQAAVEGYVAFNYLWSDR